MKNEAIVPLTADAARALRRDNTVLQGLTRLFRHALSAPNEEELAAGCLDVATSLTGSTSGFVGYVDDSGALRQLASIGWPSSAATPVSRRVAATGQPYLSNSPGPEAGPGQPAVPDPAASPILAVPLAAAMPHGVLAVGNRAGGYGPEQVEVLETLAAEIVEILAHRREEQGRRLSVEQALRETEERFRAMVGAVPSLTFEADSQGNNTFSSERWCTYTGMTLEETLGMGWLRAIHPDDAAQAASRWEHAAQVGALFESKHRLRAADGTYRWFIARALPFHDAKGKPVRWAGSLTDIDALVRAEQALRASEARFRQLADAMPQLVWTANAEGVVDYYNRRQEEFSGFARSGDGWQWAPVLHPDDRAATVAAWSRAVATGAVYEIEHRVKRADGNYRWYLSRGLPVHDGAGRVVRWFGTATDVDATKRAEETLRESDRHKNEFLATLSHELRNPLAPIRYALELLSHSGHDETTARPIQVIARQLNHLVRLVDDLLDITRIASNKIRLRRQRVEFGPVLEQALEAIERDLHAAGHSLSVEAPSTPVWLDADPDRLAQVVSNLLINAVQYTPVSGEIHVSATAVDGELRFSVSDTGLGLGHEDLDRVFEMFTQVSGVGRDGLGIGLSLVKALVELHGGTVEARSDGLGRGSEFVVRLPAAMPPVEARPAPEVGAGGPAARRRVLVVDDNLDAAEMMRAVLELEGHDVRVAGNAFEALQIASAFRPDVGLFDIGLPGIDGYELARRVRHDPALSRLHLVAVTGWGQEDDRRRALEAGFDAHMTKPADPDAVRDVVARVEGT